MIARVERVARGDLELACGAFRTELEALSDHALLRVVYDFSAAMIAASTTALWGAAHVIHGGCSDDMFWDFRTGLVALGRDRFLRALADPDSLARVADVEERTLFEGFQYVPEAVVTARGLTDPSPGHGPGCGMPGTMPTAEELPALYPRLTKRFG